MFRHYYRLHPKDDGRLCFKFVCQSTWGGGVPHPADGGYPLPRSRQGGTPSSWWGVPPSQVQVGGYPIQLMGGTPFPGPGGGISYPADGGTPFPGPGRGHTPSSWWGVPPSQVQAGAYPIQLMAVPPSQVQAGGTPHPSWWGTPHQLMGGTHFPGPGGGTPSGVPPAGGTPPPEQHSMYLLCSRQYASCIHTGGLSCFTIILLWDSTKNVLQLSFSQQHQILHFKTEFISDMLWWFFKMWNGAWNKLQFKVCQVADPWLAYLDKHSTLDPVMASVVSSIPSGGNFWLPAFQRNGEGNVLTGMCLFTPQGEVPTFQLSILITVIYCFLSCSCMNILTVRIFIFWKF